MALLLFLVLLVVLFIFLLFLFRCIAFKRHIVREFRRCNVIVDGKKGSGKDLLFSEVIYKRKEKYYANVDYGGDCDLISAKDISCAPNTYKNFIEGNVDVVDRRFVEGCDCYISDGGIYLPSYMDSVLYKTYPSFPIYYALSRHLACHNIHVNVQNFGRVWKALREQADSFIHVHCTLNLPFFLLVKATIYDDLESAMAHRRPIKTRLLNRFSKAQADLYRAQNGDIESGWVIIPKKHVRYNTRYFETVIYGDSPRLEE